MPIIARLNGAIKQMRNPYKYVYRSYIQHSAHIEKNKTETRSAVKEFLRTKSFSHAFLIFFFYNEIARGTIICP